MVFSKITMAIQKGLLWVFLKNQLKIKKKGRIVHKDDFWNKKFLYFDLKDFMYNK